MCGGRRGHIFFHSHPIHTPGSERFEPFIGTLALASAASMEGQLSMHRMQARRQL